MGNNETVGCLCNMMRHRFCSSLGRFVRLSVGIAEFGDRFMASSYAYLSFNLPFRWRTVGLNGSVRVL